MAYTRVRFWEQPGDGSIVTPYARDAATLGFVQQQRAGLYRVGVSGGDGKSAASSSGAVRPSRGAAVSSSSGSGRSSNVGIGARTNATPGEAASQPGQAATKNNARPSEAPEKGASSCKKQRSDVADLVLPQTAAARKASAEVEGIAGARPRSSLFSSSGGKSEMGGRSAGAGSEGGQRSRAHAGETAQGESHDERKTAAASHMEPGSKKPRLDVADPAHVEPESSSKASGKRAREDAAGEVVAASTRSQPAPKRAVSNASEAVEPVSALRRSARVANKEAPKR